MMPAQLICGALDRFACYLRTGSAQAALRSALLLERLALDPEVDQAVRERSQELAETIHRTVGAR